MLNVEFLFGGIREIISQVPSTEQTEAIVAQPITRAGYAQSIKSRGTLRDAENSGGGRTTRWLAIRHTHMVVSNAVSADIGKRILMLSQIAGHGREKTTLGVQPSFKNY